MGIHFVKTKRFDCMSSSKSFFELLKSHDTTNRGRVIMSESLLSTLAIQET